MKLKRITFRAYNGAMIEPHQAKGVYYLYGLWNTTVLVTEWTFCMVCNSMNCVCDGFAARLCSCVCMCSIKSSAFCTNLKLFWCCNFGDMAHATLVYLENYNIRLGPGSLLYRLKTDWAIICHYRNRGCLPGPSVTWALLRDLLFMGHSVYLNLKRYYNSNCVKEEHTFEYSCASIQS